MTLDKRLEGNEERKDSCGFYGENIPDRESSQCKHWGRNMLGEVKEYSIMASMTTAGWTRSRVGGDKAQLWVESTSWRDCKAYWGFWLLVRITWGNHWKVLKRKWKNFSHFGCSVGDTIYSIMYWEKCIKVYHWDYNFASPCHFVIFCFIYFGTILFSTYIF